MAIILNLNLPVRRLRVARYGGPVRDQKGRKATYIIIYKYINIYTRNLKFAQLVTELASLAIILDICISADAWRRMYYFIVDNYYN